MVSGATRKMRRPCSSFKTFRPTCPTLIGNQQKHLLQKFLVYFFYFRNCRMKPTKVLFHGFSDHGKTGWILRFRDKYLGMSDVNVLSVEFHAMVRTPWYTTAAKLTRFLITKPINSSINVQFRKVHLLTERSERQQPRCWRPGASNPI